VPAGLHSYKEKTNFRINQLIEANGIYKGQIGLNDIKIFIATVKEIPFDIEY